jgi:hypothetical protein
VNNLVPETSFRQVTDREGRAHSCVINWRAESLDRS